MQEVSSPPQRSLEKSQSRGEEGGAFLLAACGLPRQRPQTSVSQGERSGTCAWRWGPHVPSFRLGLGVLLRDSKPPSPSHPERVAEDESNKCGTLEEGGELMYSHVVLIIN